MEEIHVLGIYYLIGFINPLSPPSTMLTTTSLKKQIPISHEKYYKDIHNSKRIPHPTCAFHDLCRH